jgi:hypothetical protein
VTLTREKSKGRRGGESDRFARIPEKVMQSAALATAPHWAFRVLAILIVGRAKEFNGTMMCSESYAAQYGIKSHGAVYRGLLELQDRKLIVCTRHVQKLKRFAALYAVTWWPIHNRDGQPLIPPEPATHAYADWVPITPTVRVWNFKKKKKRSPLPQGDHTPTVRVTKPSHHPAFRRKTAVHHPSGKGNSKSLGGSPTSSGNGRPSSDSDSGSSSASKVPSIARARRAKESGRP